nr:MAG TPA: hypothetical protein [Caudoviricetes sp.]
MDYVQSTIKHLTVYFIYLIRKYSENSYYD